MSIYRGVVVMLPLNMWARQLWTYEAIGNLLQHDKLEG